MFESINGSRVSTLMETLETKDFAIKKLPEFIGQTKNVFGYLITKEGRYGRNVLLATDSCFISLPTRYVEKFKDFTPEEIEALKSGNIKITNIKEIDSKNGKTVVFDLV